MTTEKTEKHKAWLSAVAEADAIQQQIQDKLAELKTLRDKATEARAKVDAAASEAASEKQADGFGAIQAANGKHYQIQKNKKRRGGAEPAYPFSITETVIAVAT